MTARQFKGLVLILDGLGDRPCPELGGKTPLEAADTPVMDRITASNQCGMMAPIIPGLPVDTHTGVGMLFGLPPGDAHNLCRGPIEAAGIGLDLQLGDVLLRANLATVQKSGTGLEIMDRRAGRIQDGVDLLCSSLSEIDLGNDVSATLFPATQHRCVLRLRGPQLSPLISDTDPGGKGVSEGILLSHAQASGDAAAGNTADALNRYIALSHEILDSHEVNVSRSGDGLPVANGILTRGAGAHRNFRNLLAFLDLKAAVISGDSTILGLGNLFSFSTCTDESFTALEDTNLEKKIELAIESLAIHDIAFIHIKGTDTTAHDRNPEAKARFISRIDTALGKFDTKDLVIGICADHSTDCRRGEHNGDPVPVLIQNPVGRKDAVSRFGEYYCSNGALGQMTAQSFLTTVLDAMGCLGNYQPSEAEYFGISH